jgi:hypothetical protein
MARVTASMSALTKFSVTGVLGGSAGLRGCASAPATSKAAPSARTCNFMVVRS